MADSVLRGVIGFFEKIGVYDVVLPFLLVFTIIFAILEKSKILGMEAIGEKKYTKKNLNAMAAFVVAFLTIASAKLVEIITTVSANMVILVLLGVFFLLLIGTFYKPEDGPIEIKEKLVRNIFIAIMFIGIIFIFLDAIKTDAGDSWLEVFIGFLSQFWTSAAVASIILIVFIVIFVAWITKAPKEGTPTPPEGGSS